MQSSTNQVFTVIFSLFEIDNAIYIECLYDVFGFAMIIKERNTF